MKVGDDLGKKYRKKFLGFDPLAEKYDRYGVTVLIIFLLYLGGHLAYYFWRD